MVSSLIISICFILVAVTNIVTTIRLNDVEKAVNCLLAEEQEKKKEEEIDGNG